MKFTYVLLVILQLSLLSHAQLAEVHKVGKEPFSGKVQDINYKSGDGNWWFQSYGPGIIKTVFRPQSYTTFEQVSDAVIEKASVASVKISSAPSYTIELDNNIRVVIQKDRLFYKLGNEVKLRNVGYNANGEFRGFTFTLADGEQFYGGGERALPLNRRGQVLELYNAPAYGYTNGAVNLNFSVPLIMSSHGYAIFFDNPSKGMLDIGKSNASQLTAGFTSGDLNFYIIFGKNADEILQHYSRLTGRQPLPPRWALGNLVSRFGYRSEAQVKEVTGKMRADRFPMDAVIFDLFWFGDSIKGSMGNFDWINRQAWPDPKKMINNFKAENLKSILITEPYFLSGTKNYEQAVPFFATDNAGSPFLIKDFYFGSGGLLDIFRNSAQDFVWKLYLRQLDNGVSGWWVDLAEPEKHPADMHHNMRDLGIKRLMTSNEVHNAYGHYWSKMLHEKYSREYPSVRLFNLNRSGFAGSQRYSIFPWTGDVSRSWSGLQSQLPVLLGMSTSGIPYIHSDAGGFTAADSMDSELYTRWLQFAAFTPIFRPHATALGDLDPSLKSIPSEPTFYPEPYKNFVREAILLRYRLLPYNYSLAFDQSSSGRPLMRPMNYYSLTDPELQRAESQYYWGENILVAPVLEKGQQVKKLYLPAGNWYHQSTGEKLSGARWIDHPVKIENIPLFVKEGSFIPMWMSKSEVKSTDEYNSDDITIEYYPSTQTSTYVLFDDDGVSAKTLDKGQFELVTFTGRSQPGSVTFKISSNNPDAYKRKRTRLFSLQLPKGSGSIQKVLAGGKEVAVTGGVAKIPFEGKELSVEVVVADLKL